MCKIALVSILRLLAKGGFAQTRCFVDNTETCPKESLDDNGVNFVYPGGDTRCGFDMVDGEENPFYFQVQKVRSWCSALTSNSPAPTNSVPLCNNTETFEDRLIVL
jgi:hypothetical protein